MIVPALYFLGNKLLGQSSQLSRWEDHKVNHTNMAFFCPKCGEIWGRIMDERVAGWFAVTSLCAKHNGGSFIAPWRSSFEELPPEVLRYELQTRLDQFERSENGNQVNTG